MKANISPEIIKKELEFCHDYLIQFNIDFNIYEITNRCRTANFVFVRALMVLLLKQKGYSWGKIGAIINRDHASVLHLLKYGTFRLRNKEYDSISQQIKFEKPEFIQTKHDLESAILFHNKKLNELCKLMQAKFGEKVNINVIYDNEW